MFVLWVRIRLLLTVLIGADRPGNNWDSGAGSGAATGTGDDLEIRPLKLPEMETETEAEREMLYEYSWRETETEMTPAAGGGAVKPWTLSGAPCFSGFCSATIVSKQGYEQKAYSSPKIATVGLPIDGLARIVFHWLASK